jgi:choline-glycine betaine transporter
MVFSQNLDPTTGWEGIATAYGPVAPFALVLLIAIRVLWKRLEQEQRKVDDLTAKIMDEVIPLVSQTTYAMKEAAQAVTDSDPSTVVQVLEDLTTAVKSLESSVKASLRKK